jgi:hypothetical protein
MGTRQLNTIEGIRHDIPHYGIGFHLATIFGKNGGGRSCGPSQPLVLNT